MPPAAGAVDVGAVLTRAVVEAACARLRAADVGASRAPGLEVTAERGAHRREHLDTAAILEAAGTQLRARRSCARGSLSPGRHRPRPRTPRPDPFEQSPLTRQHAPQPVSAQSELSPWYVPPAARQSASKISAHEPSGWQQAPGWGHEVSAQVVKLPWKTPPTSAQSTSVLSTQLPSSKQHAPGCVADDVVTGRAGALEDAARAGAVGVEAVGTGAVREAARTGCGHTTFEHVESRPWKAPPAESHSVSNPSRHVPSGRQQAPGCGARDRCALGNRRPWKAPPAAAQSMSNPSLHVPSVKQHAPGCGQVVSAQVEPAPWKAPPAAAQSTSLPSLHDPSSKQHAPGCGQVVSAQVEPEPWKTPPFAAHSTSVVSVQLPSSKQHAPGCGQVTLSQSVPAPWKEPSAATQSAKVRSAHWPLGRQHAPIAGRLARVAPVEDHLDEVADGDDTVGVDIRERVLRVHATMTLTRSSTSTVRSPLVSPRHEPRQTSIARPTHSASHASEQHSGSSVHTSSQHPVVMQPGPALGS